MQLMGHVRDYASLLVFFMRLTDIILIATSGIVCFYVLQPIKFFPEFSGWLPNAYLTAIGVACLLASWWFPHMNVYRSWRGEEILSEIRSIAFAWTATFVGLIIFIFFTKSADLYSRHWIAFWFVVAFLFVSSARVCLRIFLKKLRSKGFNVRRVVLIGNGSKCKEIKQRIDSAPWIGLEITGYFGENNLPDHDQTLTHLGNLAEFSAILNPKSIDQIWITLSLKDADQIEKIAENLEKTAIEVMLVPDIFGWRLLNRSVVQIHGLPLINIAASPIKGVNGLLKSIEDKILASVFLLIASPAMLIIALMIKLTSKGPIFYTQDRVSWGGQSFKMLKFRTMPINSDLASGKPIWGSANTKSKTSIGHFLRKTSLDELPQFINVLKGDMSIVGPRPERPMFVEEFRHEIDGYMQKHLVKAGMTGWAQINGWRGDTDLKTRIEHDLYYIRHWSLWFDMKIILLTLTQGFASIHAS